MTEQLPIAKHHRATVAAMALAAVTTAIMLQSTRVFVSYMVFIIDQSERIQLGLTATVVFLAIGLGAFMPRLLPVPRALLILGMAMIATRTLLQFWSLPEARMWLGAVTVLLAGWLFPILLWRWRAATATGVGLGLLVDLAVRIARASIDLPLIPTVGAHITMMLIALVALVAAYTLASEYTKTQTPTGLAMGALALGPALTLQHLLIGNLGAAQLQSDIGMVAGAWLLGIGMVLGIGIDLFFARRPGYVVTGAASERTTVPMLIIAGGLGLLIAWQDSGGLGVVGLVVGTAATVALAIAALRSGSGTATIPRIAGWLTAGLLLQAALLFAYFTATGMPELVIFAFVVLAACSLLPILRPSRERLPARLVLGGVSTGAVIVICAALLLTIGTPTPGAKEPLPATFTTLTYNIQSGFSRDNHWDLEETAQVIEATGAEVVVLQEVGRGWPILTGADQAQWLSQRLDMQLVWGPASRDNQWGNAILTSAPIISTDTVKFDVTENLRRGAVLAVVETDVGPITIVGTHLDNPGDAKSARQAQITQLLDLWNGADPALIAGDFNTDPDSAAMATFSEAGLVDSGAVLGADATTSEDVRRIDYIVASPGLEFVTAAIPDRWASDHRPFHATFTIAP